MAEQPDCMSTFTVYFRLGLEHILDLQGYDHILFVVALCAVYALSDWRRLLWLVTAFTVGHSITLALATLRLVTVSGPFVEMLIALTILVTSVLGIWQIEQRRRLFRSTADPIKLKYALALVFGLIHGLGFSSFLRSVLGEEDSLFVPLLAFNVGLEIGQIVILAALLVVSFLVVRLVRMEAPSWALVLLGATGGMSLLMVLERLPALGL